MDSKSSAVGNCQADASDDLVVDGKNGTNILCQRCGSVVLKPNCATRCDKQVRTIHWFDSINIIFVFFILPENLKKIFENIYDYTYN